MFDKKHILNCQQNIYLKGKNTKIYFGFYLVKIFKYSYVLFLRRAYKYVIDNTEGKQTLSKDEENWSNVNRKLSLTRYNGF
jgi:hypothetical protein